MNVSTVQRRFVLAACAAALATLYACGGGGGGGDAAPVTGTPTSFSGTVARGAPLVGATVTLTAANGTVFTATTNAQGAYTTGTQNATFPVVAVATLGAISLRSIGFGGSSVNATPLTELLVSVVLAAATSGSTPLTLAQFNAKVASDATFAASVSKPEAVAQYRAGVITVVRTQLIASGKRPEEADAILAAVANSSFESAPLVIGSPADQALDAIGPVILDASGNVKASVTAQATAAGDTLPTPPSGGTGTGTGG